MNAAPTPERVGGTPVTWKRDSLLFKFNTLSLKGSTVPGGAIANG